MKNIILSGQTIQLETLQQEHFAELKQIAEDEQIWTYLPTRAIGNNFAKWFDTALKNSQQEREIPFAVRELATQKLVGSTCYYDINPAHKRISIGYTWYIPALWGTKVNPECKLLLLSHAFEELNLNRVEFYTDVRNSRSHAAIKKLGAKEEGIMRQHMILDDGHIRDTIMFSIIKTEWQDVKASLLNRLEKTA